MSSESFVPRHSFEGIVLDCITELGIARVRLGHLAARLGHSRASMYRVYGSCRGLFVQIHQAVLERLDFDFSTVHEERRAAFDTWWLAVSRALRSSHGQAFRALRPVVATGEAADALVRMEICELRHLNKWVRAHATTDHPALVSEIVWMLMLRAAAMPEEDSASIALRELAWSVVTGGRLAMPESAAPTAH